MFIIFKTLGNKATVFKLGKIDGISQMLIPRQGPSLPMVIGMIRSDRCDHTILQSLHVSFKKL